MFARRHGLDPQRVGHWVRRLHAEITAEESPMPFHPVRLTQSAATTGMGEQPPIEIVLADGRVVRVPCGVDARELRLVLTVLEEGPC